MASVVEQVFQAAAARYAELGVNVASALEKLASIPISMHCWQGDDVGGFESDVGLSGGGIMATGSYPGKARNADELRQDADQAFRLIPGRHRFNLHAIYLETGGQKVERDAIAPEHFSRWMDWAAERGIGLDFNPTFFSHPMANDGFTLTHPDGGIRGFWIRHGIACRKIGEAFGRRLGSACVTNVWIPDGQKDLTADRQTPRRRLADALDEIFRERIDAAYLRDSVESKLFGIGSETYVPGSHEFYLGYAITRKKLLTLDTGHFHPTENIADKLSSVLLYLDGVLLHVSRGIRWDSDHVVIFNDETRAVAEEIVRGDHAGRVLIGLDFFDASIHRVAAWVTGMRAMLKAMLWALLEPIDQLRELEAARDYTARLVLFETIKTLPFGAVWDYYCRRHDVPLDAEIIGEVRRYEREVTNRRG